MPTRDAQLWTIDAIAEGIARVAVDADTVLHLPRCLLPADARAGEVLRVRHVRDGARSRLTLTRDAEATQRALARSARQAAGIPLATDGGGDVAL